MSPAVWAFAGALVTSVLTWARTAWERRRSSPETTATLVGVSVDFVAEIRQELAAVRVENRQLRSELDEVRSRVREVENEVHAYRTRFGPLI